MKNPESVKVLKLLSNYVGNVDEWNFTDAQKDKFKPKAALIRDRAADIYESIKVRFKERLLKD